MELDKRVAVSYIHVRVSMHAKSCLMQDRGQSAEGQEGQKHTAPRSCPSSREPTIQSVLNPSGAFVPGPGKCGGEGRQRWRGGHKRTPPDLKGEKETHSGKYIQQKPYHLPRLQPRFPRKSPKKLLNTQDQCWNFYDRQLTAILANNRCPDMFINPLVKCLPEITWNL